MCDIVKKQLALPEDTAVTPGSKFAELGADSLDTVIPNYLLLLSFSTKPINIVAFCSFFFSTMQVEF